MYPLPPPGSRLMFRIPEGELSALDQCVVASTSLFIVGSVIWVPLLYGYALRKWRTIPRADRRRRIAYAAIAVVSLALLHHGGGPHRHPRVGEWLRVRKWKIWSSWLSFIAMEVRADQTSKAFDVRKKDQRVLHAFVPHGIFPFAFAFAALPEIVQKKAFGTFRPVVATATKYFPIVSDFLQWLRKMYVSWCNYNV